MLDEVLVKEKPLKTLLLKVAICRRRLREVSSNHQIKETCRIQDPNRLPGLKRSALSAAPGTFIPGGSQLWQQRPPMWRREPAPLKRLQPVWLCHLDPGYAGVIFLAARWLYPACEQDDSGESESSRAVGRR